MQCLTLCFLPVHPCYTCWLPPAVPHLALPFLPIYTCSLPPSAPYLLVPTCPSNYNTCLYLNSITFPSQTSPCAPPVALPALNQPTTPCTRPFLPPSSFPTPSCHLPSLAYPSRERQTDKPSVYKWALRRITRPLTPPPTHPHDSDSPRPQTATLMTLGAMNCGVSFSLRHVVLLKVDSVFFFLFLFISSLTFY